MKKSIVFLIVVISCFMYSCKKDANNRITNTTYELDSVVESYLDTAGNVINLRTIPIIADYIKNYVLEISPNNNSDITYYESNDSILLKLFENTYNLRDYTDIIDGKFYRLYSEYYEFGNHDIEQIKRQNITYNSNDKIHSITSTFVDYSFSFKGNTSIEWPDTTQCMARNKNEIIFTYELNNLASLDYDYFSGFSNTPQVSAHNRLFNYTNHYKNQKSLIGIDVNDIILSSFLFKWYNVSHGLGSPTLQKEFYDLQLPLILNKQATFNTNCDDLIEHIQFSTFISHTVLDETDISYEFDLNFDNRIKSMIINNYTKYTFYYKN